MNTHSSSVSSERRHGRINRISIDEASSSSDSGSNLPPDSMEKEDSFLAMVKQEARKAERDGTHNDVPKKLFKKRMRKSIFISYSPEAGFAERKFVVETVRQLKENNLAEDIWFDKDEGSTKSPCWFSVRMEAVERCRGAILFLSDAYFSSLLTTCEGKALLDRRQQDPSSVHVFAVLFSLDAQSQIPAHIVRLGPTMLVLEAEVTTPAERATLVVGALLEHLETIASIGGAPTPPAPEPEEDVRGEYRWKQTVDWTVTDVQEWLLDIGVNEFHRESFADGAVDGFLLQCVTEQDMSAEMRVDSRLVRKKIMTQIQANLIRDQQMAENWHQRAKAQKVRPKTLYVASDPNDGRLVQNLKVDLTERGFQVRASVGSLAPLHAHPRTPTTHTNSCAPG